MTNRLRHRKVASTTNKVKADDWNDWLIDENGVEVDVDTLVGPQGPAGPQGNVGAQGIPGNDGAQGIQGIQGETGDTGSQGIPGNDGAPGEQGVKGDAGDTGPKGEIGDAGPKGDQGIQGEPGADSTVPGPEGPQGVPGNDGPQGIQGVPGNDGIQGIQGVPGNDGAKGDTGLQGDQGIQGEPGVKGDTGLQGDQGIQGVPGNDGAGVPAGGTTDQVLAKIDGADYNTKWATPTGGGGAHDHTSGDGSGVLTNDEHDGYSESAGIAVPAAPVSGKLRTYARNRSGKMFLEMIGPAGVDTSLQPALFGNNVVMWLPGTGTTAALSFGLNWSITATQAHPTLAATNLLTSMGRATYTTAATAGGGSGVRSGKGQFWRGNAAGLGGFFFFARFGVVTYNAGMQMWVGLSGVSTALAGEPSAQNNTVCIGKDSGDTNWQLITRSASAATKTDLGLAVAANQVIDVMFFAPPNSSNITARVIRLDSPAVIADNIVLDTNLPVNTAFMYAHAHNRNGAVATAVSIALNRIYIESDV